MGIIVRQGLKSTIVSYVGVAIGAFNVLWLYPKFLSPEEIGLVNLLQSLGLFFATFTQIGAPNIADKFFAYFKNEAKQHNGFLFFLIILPLIGILTFVTVFIGFKDFWLSIYEEKASAINEYFYYLIPLTIFMVYHSILEAYCRAYLRIVVPVLLRDVVLRIFTLALVLTYMLGYISFDQFILLMVGSYGVILSFLLAYIYFLKGLFLRPALSYLTKPLFKEIALYAAYILLGGAGSVVVAKIDILMIPSLIGDKALGIYTISFFIGTVIEIPRRSLSQISTPIIAQAWADNDLPKIESIYKKSSINQLLVGAFLFLGIWSNIDAIFNLVPNSELYRQGKYVVFFIGLARLIDMGSGVNSEIILQSAYYKFNLISIAILALLLVLTNLIFVPYYGIEGAAFATALSVLLYNLLKYLFLRIKYKMQPFSSKTLLAFGIIAISYLAATLVPDTRDAFFPTLLNIAFRSTVIAVTFSILAFSLKVSPDANELLLNIIRRLKNARK
jgi:O-antigen/teichoic acid export membrane protein